ncbi:MAG: hypothetical protein J1D77_02180 [Muribaculaceae bacterium]|nr:hypothetical protein [Muribaculaceae bacterium]
MSKFLLSLFSLLLVFPLLHAQNPEAIYIATWETMSELGSEIKPSDSDPKLTYNAQTGCYEGEIINWLRTQVNPYNAKIPYSVDGGEITYYGVAGTSQSIVFNTTPTASFKFTESTDPSSFKGWVVAYSNELAVVDVKVSIDLASSTITFTKFDSGAASEIPTLVSVEPASGTEIELDENGGTTIVLTFSGPVDSMEVLSEDASVQPQVSDDGKVWTLPISSKVVEGSAAENQGLLILKIQKVYAAGLPVTFGNGSSVLELVYTIAGLSSEVTFVFEGDPTALQTLNVYRSPYYSVGDQIDFEGNTLTVNYVDQITYLITIGKDYEMSFGSTVAPKEGENWAVGQGYSTEKGENGETTNIPAETGMTLTLYRGSNGGVFTFSITDEAGVESIFIDRGENRIYTINGQRLKTTDPTSLHPGIYIVNGKKVMVK